MLREKKKGSEGWLTSNLEASPRAETGTDGWEQNKLNNGTRQPIRCRNHANAARVQTKSSRKVERQMRVVSIGHLARIVEKHGKQLVSRDRVEREKCVGDEVDDDVAGEDVSHTRCFGVAGAALLGQPRRHVCCIVGCPRKQRGRSLGVDKRGPVATGSWTTGTAVVVSRLVAATVKGARDFLAEDEAPVAIMSLRLERFLEEQGSYHDGDEEEDAGHQVGQQERVLVQEPTIAKEGRVLRGRLGEKSAERGTEDGADAPDKRHQSKGSRLEFFLRNHFGNDRANDAD